MIKVSDRGDGDDKITEEFDIEKELSIIIEKKLLSQKFATKIVEKLKKNKIKITKEQLYELVGKIQEIMQTYSESSTTDMKKASQPINETEIVESISNADMKKLLDSIEKLDSRIKTIEDETIQGIKGVTGKIVKTKDIKTIDKSNLNIQKEIEPLLEIPNDPESIVVLMKWLQYLVDKLGKIHLPNVLGYYVDIDWISDDVRLDLIEYSKGITDNNKKDEPKKELANLSTRDHIQSLLFIQKLKGNQLDDRFVWRIDRELEKMSKSIEDYQFN
jgi:flagellar protein FlaD